MFCRKISFVASSARNEGGVAKKWRMMTRGRGGGHDTPSQVPRPTCHDMSVGEPDYDTPQNLWRHLWTAPYEADSPPHSFSLTEKKTFPDISEWKMILLEIVLENEENAHPEASYWTSAVDVTSLTFSAA